MCRASTTTRNQPYTSTLCSVATTDRACHVTHRCKLVARRNNLEQKEPVIMNTTLFRLLLVSATLVAAAASGIETVTPDAVGATEGSADAADDSTDTGKGKAVTAGYLYSCGIRLNDTAVCWGDNERGQTDTPSGGFKTVSAGDSHSCGIRLNDRAVCWGNNFNGVADAPSGGFKTVSAGAWHSCGIRLDDTAVCWGDNQYGQASVPSGGFKTVSAGAWHSCGIRLNDRAVCWGRSRWGQSDAPSGVFKAIDAGGSHSCGIRLNDRAVCWGPSRWGQSDAPSGVFKTVSAGRSHSCGVRLDDTAVCRGDNEYGQSDAPSGGFKTVSAGDSHSCGIRLDDTVVCWGDNEHGQTDTASADFKSGETTGYGDVHAREYYADAVQWAFDNSITGVHGACFAPGAAVSRGETAVWIYNMENQPDIGARHTYSDITEFAQHDAVSWMSNAGITTGTSPTTFAPNDRLTRAQAAAFLHRLKGEPSASPHKFSDVVADWQQDPVSWMLESGITTGTSPTTFAPDETLTRAELVTFLYRYQNTPTITFDPDTPTCDPTAINTWDRGAVVAAWEAEFGRTLPDRGYTGDVANCVAGTTSQEFRDSVVQRANWYRRMAGLTTVTERPEYSEAAQHAALIMAANQRTSHHPSADWECYSEKGYSGASNSNLYLGISGERSIDGYIRDPGSNNHAVGHRQWILNPEATEFGTGDTPASNALWVAQSRERDQGWVVRDPRGFVAWPPSGYVPYTSVWGRWSFEVPDRFETAAQVLGRLNAEGRGSFEVPDGFDPGATVYMADESGLVEVEIIHNGANSIVWAVAGDTNSARHPRPRDGDHCYTVTISTERGADDAVQDPYSYVTCVIDPEPDS